MKIRDIRHTGLTEKDTECKEAEEMEVRSSLGTERGPVCPSSIGRAVCNMEMLADPESESWKAQ